MNIDQRALCKWIAAGLQISEVTQLHGDSGWLLGNMVAKYTLAADHYKLSTGALQYLRENDVDLSEIHPRSRFYGKKSPLLYEHSIPAAIIRNVLITIEPTVEKVSEILRKAGSVVAVLRTEDALLNACGLSRKMPPQWHLGDDPLARYKAADIQLSDRVLKVRGKICR